VLLAGCAGEQQAGEVFGFPPLQADNATAPPRAAPRWEPVTEITRAGAGRHEVTIAADAIQWRMRWTCDAGSLRLDVDADGRVVDGACPGDGEAYSIRTGRLTLTVEASAPWTVTIEQQVDTALDEAPLDGMRRSSRLASGDVVPIEKHGSGTAAVFELAAGRYALRLTDLDVSTNSDLYVWLSTARSPQTSAEIVAAPHVEIAELKSTLGSQNYVLPSDLTPDQMRSVVIWCKPLRIAYAAAELRW
jgi:hypothetical protein